MRVRWIAWAVAFGCVVTVGAWQGGPAALGADEAAGGETPAALVDPFVGTGSGGHWVGQVDTFPGASVPFGMMQWSPDTDSRPDGGGYNHEDHRISGFSLTHLSGPGCPVAGDVPFLPLAGPDAGPADARATASFGHAGEVARPGYYAVTAGGVRTELSTTLRTGVARFGYPAGRVGRLLVKAGGSATHASGASVRTIGDSTVVGQVTSGHFCGNRNRYTLYFAARFDRPVRAARIWPPGAKGPAPGATLTFDTRRDRTVGMQVAVSYVSVAGARANLAAEARCPRVECAADRATAAWNRQLGAVSVAGGSRTRRQIFYTALYHSLLHPSVFSDADGRYPGFDGRIHRTRPGHAQYADFSGWDIYRCQIPLLALIAPAQADDMALSLLDDADQNGGWLPKWPVANGQTDVMNGDPADAILADVLAFGDGRLDRRRALRLMVHGAEDQPGPGDPPGQGRYVERPGLAAYLARGYVPNTFRSGTADVNNGASTTLEYAVADFAVARLAAALGDGDTARRFRERSHNWSRLFDRATRYVRPRDAAGAFPAGPPVAVRDGMDQDGFQEGNAAQYTWMVPQDLPALIGALGGRAAADSRLDAYFRRLNAGPGEPYHWQGNEPAFGTPWIYDSTGSPDRAQEVVRAIADGLYALTPGGEPGNDDLGAMSSWYVWAALGLYPQFPGAPLLALSTPLFPSAVLHGPGGHDLTVTAAGSGPYVAGLVRDGTPTTATWTDLSASRLDFTLTPDRGSGWGTDPADAPPAFP